MFGIQARGGCACAGPYAEDLLGMNLELARAYEKMLKEDKLVFIKFIHYSTKRILAYLINSIISTHSRLDRHHLRRTQESSQYEMLRPGFSRLNLAYFLDDEQINYVVEAVQLIAEHGWQLLPFYKFNPETAEWRHTSESVCVVLNMLLN